MKPVPHYPDRKTGFTIVELLTVMSIIIILIGLLVPALNRVRRYALRVKQKAQFHAISVALDLFSAEQQNYPPSDRLDPVSTPYCGAMKLAEAMVGQDLTGFNPNSRFCENGTIDCQPAGTALYPVNPGMASPQYALYLENVKSRKIYLQLENANAYRLFEIYTDALRTSTPAPNFAQRDLVLCDVYVRTMATGNKIGMPILYYRADTSRTEHDANVVPNCGAGTQAVNIYNRCDNQELVDIPVPWDSTGGPVHPMASAGMTPGGIAADPAIFYQKTWDSKISNANRPSRADSYILWSAGFDNEYGNADDILNFGE